ncbi:hypothetical protein BD309DRAFT_951199 [Dichomitus squalens]|nr:hypothetical protein BD309DRAFT_951199 [Dichomitus squalens]
MDGVSTIFVETCVFINGVGGCSTVIGRPTPGTPAPLTFDSPTTTSSSTSRNPPKSTSTTVIPTISTSNTSSRKPSSSPLASIPVSTAPDNTSLVSVPPPRSSSESRSSSTSQTLSSSSSPTQSQSHSSEITRDASGTGTLPSAPTSPSLSSSRSASLLPSASSSHPSLAESTIVGIATSLGAALLLLAFGVWYAVRRKRRRAKVQISESTIADLDQEYEATASTREALLSAQSDIEKLRGGQRSSVAGTVGVSRCSTIVQTSSFGPFLNHGAAQAVPSPTSTSEKRSTGAAASGTITNVALSLASEERPHPTVELGSEDPGDRHVWEENVDGGREHDGRRTRLFRYEADGGVRLAGGPLDGGDSSTEVDQLNDSMVVTMPPPYSRY